MKKGFIAGGIVFGLGLIGLLGYYGTLRPCEMLKRNLRAGVTKALVGQAAKPSETLAEQMVAGLSPFQCVRALVRMKPPGSIFHASTPKPSLDWRNELKVRNSEHKVEHGYAIFKGEVQNVGRYAIKSLRLHVFMFDRNGRKIGLKSETLVYWFDPMWPGNIKPFSVMAKPVSTVSTLDRIKYTFEIGDYENFKTPLAP